MFSSPEGKALTRYYLQRLVSELRWGRRGIRPRYTVPVSAIIKALKRSSLNYFGHRGWRGRVLRAGRGLRHWLPVILCQGTSMSLVAGGI